MLSLAGRNVSASSSCEVNLPRDPVNMTATVNEYNKCKKLGNFISYIDATFSDVTGSYSVGNGIYPGFCADLQGSLLDNPHSGAQYQVQLLSSIDNPPLRLTVPWDLINYVMNYTPNDSWLDKQAAIWSLVHGCGPEGPLFDCPPLLVAPHYFPYGTWNASGPFGCPNSNPPVVDIRRVKEIVEEARNQGVEFTPGPGDLVAIIMDPLSCSGSDYCNDPDYQPMQITFITAQCCSGSIADFVWYDKDCDGIQNRSEPGIGKVTVNLRNTDNSLIATTTTNASGFYQFTGLCAGTYRVEAVSPTGYNPTASLAGKNRAVDGNKNPASVTLRQDKSVVKTVDFGFCKGICSGGHL